MKRILLAAATAFLLTALFPPWSYTGAYQNIRYERSAEYGFLFVAPAPDFSRDEFGVHIDLTRLMLEWLVIVAAGVIAWAVWVMPRARHSLFEPIIRLPDHPALSLQPEKDVAPKDNGLDQPATDPFLALKLPELTEAQFRSMLADFIETEFKQDGNNTRRQAFKFIFARLKLAAQHYYGEHQSLKGFADSEHMRSAAKKYKEIKAHD